VKTDDYIDEPAERFETRLKRGLDHIASQTPTRSPLEFDPDAVPLVAANTSPNRRLVPYLTAAAAAVVIVAGLVVITSRTDPRRAAAPVDTTATNASTAPSVSTAPNVSTPSTVVQPVRGVPICDAELPITIKVPAATSGPNPGPAVYGPTSEGQFAQYWELPAGTIEVRWPPDPREMYDLDTPRVRGNPSVFDSMTVSVPDDGSQAIVDIPNLGGATLTMTTNPKAAGLAAPCDVLQVRYIDLQGNQTTRGYKIADFKSDPTFGKDLNPLITSTHTAGAPDPATVVTCGGNDIDTDVTGLPSATAADALLAFLDSGKVPGLMTSRYSEFTASKDETSYAIIIDDRLITDITVTHAPEGWTVSHVKASGC
jgi:hypothetical protein